MFCSSNNVLVTLDNPKTTLITVFTGTFSKEVVMLTARFSGLARVTRTQYVERWKLIDWNCIIAMSTANCIKVETDDFHLFCNFCHFKSPSIIYTCLSFSRIAGGLSLSQLTLGGRQGTSWTAHYNVNEQTLITLTPRDYKHSQLHCMLIGLCNLINDAFVRE